MSIYPMVFKSMHQNVLLLSFHMRNFCPMLVFYTCCNDPSTVWSAGTTMRGSVNPVRGRMYTTVLVRGGEQPPKEEQSHQYDTDEVDTHSPPGLCVTAGADPVNGHESIDA